MSDQDQHGGPVPASPPAAPKTRRTVQRVVTVVGVVLACMVAVGLGILAVSTALNKAHVEQAVSLAEEHFEAATDALEAASPSIGLFTRPGDPPEAQDAQRQLLAARDEIAAARVAIGTLDESAGKTMYLASLDSATQAVKGIEQMKNTLELLSRLSAQITQGSAAVRSADTLLDAAMDAGNDGRYPAMKSKAAAASARYATASAAFATADRLEPTAGLGPLLAYVELRTQQADLAARMAAYGQTGRIAAYNKQVGRQKALDASAEKTGEPDIVSNPKWFEERVIQQQSDYEAAGQRADELRSRALSLFGYSAQ